MKTMNMEANPSSGENIKTLFGGALNTIKTGVSGWLNKIMPEPSSNPLIEGELQTKDELENKPYQMNFMQIQQVILNGRTEYASCKISFETFDSHTYAYIIDPRTGEIKGLCEIISRYTDADGIEPITCTDTLNTYIGKFFDRYHDRLEPENITGSIDFRFEGNNISLSKENKQYHISGTGADYRILTDAYISENRNEILGYYYQNRKFLQPHPINPHQSGEIQNEEILTVTEKEQEKKEKKGEELKVLSDLMYKIGKLGLSIQGFSKKLSFEQSKKQMNTIIRALEIKAEYERHLEKLKDRLEYIKTEKDKFFQGLKKYMFQLPGAKKLGKYEKNASTIASHLQKATQQEDNGVQKEKKIVEKIQQVNGVIRHISADVGLQCASNDETSITDKFVA